MQIQVKELYSKNDRNYYFFLVGFFTIPPLTTLVPILVPELLLTALVLDLRVV